LKIRVEIDVRLVNNQQRVGACLEKMGKELEPDLEAEARPIDFAISPIFLAEHVEPSWPVACDLRRFDTHAEPSLFYERLKTLKLIRLLAIPDVSKETVASAAVGRTTKVVLLRQELFILLKWTQRRDDSNVYGVVPGKLNGCCQAADISVEAKTARTIFGKEEDKMSTVIQRENDLRFDLFIVRVYISNANGDCACGDLEAEDPPPCRSDNGDRSITAGVSDGGC
jgi:hypothetical protein